ncbi:MULTISPECIES: helix-turn-helix domain-containing protein [unclassified Acidovorax]|uniref:GlxA family transcriptional regulator n=1 Tax=unclassified Acidovorax TaxID=2684926 RepID=UPI0028833114|nr:MULTISPECIES: helix-turn-helix domain-containing protein [unclassified Acidovorax]
MKSVRSPSFQPHRVACLALPGVLPFDLATACESFRYATSASGQPCYQVAVCAEQDELDAGPFAIRIKHGLAPLETADTIVVPGILLPQPPLTPAVVGALRQAVARGARIASICSGAFVLAEAGLLDGLRATTHWLAAPELAQRYPAIKVDPAVLFVDNGQVLTSAGAAAGIDLCLHMIRADFGAAVAAHVARLSVVPLQREGGQAQFIPPSLQASDRTLQPLVTWALAHLHQPLTLASLAQQACSSTRTLHRRFSEQFGESPAQWLIRVRVQRAQELLERGDLSVEQIVGEVGLGSAANFRQQFQRIVGVSPSQYRKSFGRRDKGPSLASQAVSHAPGDTSSSSCGGGSNAKPTP